MNDLVCETCGTSFPFYQSKGRPVPRFCSHKCRGHTGFRPGAQIRISELTEEEKFERLKKSFEKHVIRQEGCWDWKGHIRKNGYAAMSCRPSIGPTQAHRASYVIHKGPIPKGMCVCHNCPGGDNPRCTNPEHLWIGSQIQNNDDKIAKGRSRYVNPPRKLGSLNGTAVLDEEKVREIKKLISEGNTQNSIAEKFGVTKTTIYRIRKGTHWKHVTID